MPSHLVFAGGGARTLVFLSSIEVLAKKNLLKDVKHYWGNSAGALLATLLSLKTPIVKLRSLFETFDFTKLRDIDLINLMSFGDHWGLDSGTAFIKNVSEVLEDVKPGASLYTLQEVPGLHITAADLTIGKPVILDSTSFPTLKIVDALRASTSIPFFYKPFKNPVDGHLLVDGAVACNFPWVLLPNDKIRADAFGFDISSSHTKKEPTSLSEYIPSVLNFRERLWSSHLLKPEGSNILRFSVPGFPVWHLGLNKEDRDELFAIGTRFTENWIRQRSGSDILRTPPSSAHHYTHSKVSPVGRKDGSSDSRGFSHPPPRQDLSQGLSLPCSPSRRRWSV